MLHLMKSEFIKLRTLRSTLTATIVLIIFPVAVTVLSAMFAKNPDETMVIKVLVNTGIVSLLLCGVLGVFAIAQEYSQGTIRITFAATPMRMKVFVAKALVISLWVAVSVAVLEGVGLIGANYALHSRGFDFGVIYNPSIFDNHSGHGDSAWQVLFAFGAVCILFALVGFALGALLRSSPGAIATLILVPLLVEGIVTGLLIAAFDIDISRRTPFTAAIRAVQVEPDAARWGLVGYFSIWCLVITVIAALLMKRRDA
jgi:ABC-2 type transport system permease protein